MPEHVLIIGSGHLAYRLKLLVQKGGADLTHLPGEAFKLENTEGSMYDAIAEALKSHDLSSFKMIYLVDDKDERNLQLLIALVSLHRGLHITCALFNENIAPHLRAAHPNVQILNPAKIAAPTFVKALDVGIDHPPRYKPVEIEADERNRSSDRLIPVLGTAFLGLVLGATVYFHFSEHFSWIDSLYFVVVTVATVGYGDINLLNASTLSKAIGIGVILASTVFIWLIFSLTMDRIIKKRGELALGRKEYHYRDHVILCGLGRLGFFIAEGLLARGERVVIIESEGNSPNIEHFRNKGADVYVGNARDPRVLLDVGVVRAKAVLSVINNDYTNLEIGLNARSFVPEIKLILRIFDASMSQKVKENMDIHLTYSMTAIADQVFYDTLSR